MTHTQTEMFNKKERKKRTPAPNIYNEFLWYFKKRWESQYKGRDFVVAEKQYGQAKHLLKAAPGFPGITKEEALRRVDRFLANPHFKACSHTFGKLFEHWDMFTATIAAENKPIRTMEEQIDTELKCVCVCGNVTRAKRSLWLQYKNKTFQCKHCKKTINVNDVLNKIPSLQDHLPQS